MGIGKRGDKLVIDFRCYLPDNRRVRCVERMGPDNPTNRKRADSIWQIVDNQLKQGTFDYLKLFPHGSKAKYFDKTKTDITFSEYWDRWLNTLAIRRGTRDNRQYMYENHFKPHFGPWKLSDISEEDILVYRKSLLDKGYKASTINNYMKIFCMPLKRAMKQGLIESYPCEDLTRLKESKPDMNPFSLEELKKLLDYLRDNDPEWHDLILCWSRTGVRPGELYALTWKRVDLHNKQILIRENRPYYGGVGPTKTESSNREINLRPEVVEVLQNQKARTGSIDKWVFLNPKDKQWNATTFRDAFKQRLKSAGLKVRPPKQMRHTFATLHIAAGESITWVSNALGHVNVEITLKRYNGYIRDAIIKDGTAFEEAYNKIES